MAHGSNWASARFRRSCGRLEHAADAPGSPIELTGRTGTLQNYIGGGGGVVTRRRISHWMFDRGASSAEDTSPWARSCNSRDQGHRCRSQRSGDTRPNGPTPRLSHRPQAATLRRPDIAAVLTPDSLRHPYVPPPYLELIASLRACRPGSSAGAPDFLAASAGLLHGRPQQTQERHAHDPCWEVLAAGADTGVVHLGCPPWLCPARGDLGPARQRCWG